MSDYSIPTELTAVLERFSEKIRKRRQAVLFHRGEAAFGMFLVLEGSVSLDFGVDGTSPLNGTYGAGALVGLPATLTGRNYSMTATVTDDAELGFISREGLRTLLRERPELGQHLLAVLSARLAQTDQVKKAMLAKEGAPEQEVALA